MNKINSSFIIAIIITYTSCINKFHLGTQTVIGNEQLKFVFSNNTRGDSTGGVSLDFKNNNNSKKISMNQKGDIERYNECNQLGGHIYGGTEMIFRKNRLWIVRFNDSNGNFSGPIFMYKKNGKLKHILIYKNSHYVSTFYTSSPKSIANDTFKVR